MNQKGSKRMTITINLFVLGVLATLFTEFVALIIYSIVRKGK